MNKIVKKVVAFLEEKHGEKINEKYRKDRIEEIVLNCVSLSETWFSKAPKDSKLSYELTLFNKNGVLSETLHGVTKDNVAASLSDILITKSDQYSKITLNSFSFNDESKRVKTIGEIEIS